MVNLLSMNSMITNLVELTHDQGQHLRIPKTYTCSSAVRRVPTASISKVAPTAQPSDLLEVGSTREFGSRHEAMLVLVRKGPSVHRCCRSSRS